jgi:phage repressor protein C with HTH and peptisase S24 domain
MKKVKIVTFYVVCTLALIYIALNYKIAHVTGHSMEPTLSDGAFCVVAVNCELQDGDIVIMDTTNSNKGITVPSIVKRYIADQSSDEELYLLGDNRDHSLDSRKLGRFPKSDLIGKVVLHF